MSPSLKEKGICFEDVRYLVFLGPIEFFASINNSFTSCRVKLFSTDSAGILMNLSYSLISKGRAQPPLLSRHRFPWGPWQRTRVTRGHRYVVSSINITVNMVNPGRKVEGGLQKWFRDEEH